jgi:hypothetical protein
MEEVEPSKLIPDEFYYLENKKDKTMKAKGKFLYIFEGEKIFGGTQAAFIIVPSKKIKSKKMEFNYSNSVRGFPISSYKFYKPLPEDVIDRYQQKVEEDRVTAVEKMINQKKLPSLSDAIDPNTLFKRTSEHNNRAFIEDDQTFYGSEPDKTNIGTQLKDIYSAYLIDKKTAKGTRRKSRKTTKPRKTKKTKKSIKSRKTRKSRSRM